MWYEYLFRQYLIKIKPEQQMEAASFIHRICIQAFEEFYYRATVYIELPLSIFYQLNKRFSNHENGSVDVYEFKEFLFILLVIYTKIVNEDNINNEDFLFMTEIIDDVIQATEEQMKTGKDKHLYLIELDTPEWQDDWDIDKDEDEGNMDLEEDEEERERQEKLHFIHLAEVAVLRRLNYNLSIDYKALTPLLINYSTIPVYILSLYQDIAKIKNLNPDLAPVLDALEKRILYCREFVIQLVAYVDAFIFDINAQSNKIELLTSQIEQAKSESTYAQPRIEDLKESYCKHQPFIYSLEKIDSDPSNAWGYYADIADEIRNKLKELAIKLREYSFDLILKTNHPNVTSYHLRADLIKFGEFILTNDNLYKMDNFFLQNSCLKLLSFLVDSAEPKHLLYKSLNDFSQFYSTSLNKYPVSNNVINYTEKLIDIIKNYLAVFKNKKINVDNFNTYEALLFNHLNYDIQEHIPSLLRNQWITHLRQIVNHVMIIKQFLINSCQLRFSSNMEIGTKSSTDKNGFFSSGNHREQFASEYDNSMKY